MKKINFTFEIKNFKSIKKFLKKTKSCFKNVEKKTSLKLIDLIIPIYDKILLKIKF